jgi:hypothetical protein
MTIGRRPPYPPPGFEQLMNKGGPQDFRKVGALLEQYLHHLSETSYNGLPNNPGGSGGETTEELVEQAEMLGLIAWQKADEGVKL